MVDAFILPFIRVPPQNKSLIIKGKNLKSVHDDDDIEKTYLYIDLQLGNSVSVFSSQQYWKLCSASKLLLDWVTKLVWYRQIRKESKRLMISNKYYLIGLDNIFNRRTLNSSIPTFPELEIHPFNSSWLCHHRDRIPAPTWIQIAEYMLTPMGSWKFGQPVRTWTSRTNQRTWWTSSQG